MTRLLREHDSARCPECKSERVCKGTAGSSKHYCYDCGALWKLVPPDEPKQKRLPGKGEIRGRS